MGGGYSATAHLFARVSSVKLLRFVKNIVEIIKVFLKGAVINSEGLRNNSCQNVTLSRLKSVFLKEFSVC